MITKNNKIKTTKKRLKKRIKKLEKSIEFYNELVGDLSVEIPLIFKNLPPNHKVIKCETDAMHPTIKEGGYIIVDTDPNQPKVDDIYAVSIDDITHVYRVQIWGNEVNLIRDNHLYQPDDKVKITPPHNVRFIGRRILTIQ